MRESQIASVIQDFCHNEFLQLLATPDQLSQAKEWLPCLIFAVVFYCICSGVAVTVKSSNFLAFKDIVPITFQDTPSKLQLHRKAAPLSHIAIIQVYIARVLQCWFSMPVSFVSKDWAWLMKILTDTLGTGCLLIPGIWEVFQDLPP